MNHAGTFPRLTLASAAALGVLIFAATASAELTVTIESVEPSNELADGGAAVISWKIETDGESGEYRVEVGGDGTPGSGELIDADDGQGDFSGDFSDSSTVQADEDLNEGDGDYVVYVIASADDEEGTYASASTTLTLQNVPYAPRGLSASEGDGRLFLAWDEHEDRDLSYFNLYYDTDPGETAGDYTGTGASGGDSPIRIGVVSEYSLDGLQNDVKYFVRISAVDDADQESDLSDEASGTPVTVLGLAGLTNEDGNCFVATAAFGDYNAPEVRILREFRDRILRESGIGRAAIELYAVHGPKAATLIAGHPMRCAAGRLMLWPAVALAWMLLNPLAIAASAAACAVLVLIGRRSMQRRPA